MRMSTDAACTPWMSEIGCLALSAVYASPRFSYRRLLPSTSSSAASSSSCSRDAPPFSYTPFGEAIASLNGDCGSSLSVGRRDHLDVGG